MWIQALRPKVSLNSIFQIRSPTSSSTTLNLNKSSKNSDSRKSKKCHNSSMRRTANQQATKRSRMSSWPQGVAPPSPYTAKTPLSSRAEFNSRTLEPIEIAWTSTIIKTAILSAMLTKMKMQIKTRMAAKTLLSLCTPAWATKSSSHQALELSHQYLEDFGNRRSSSYHSVTTRWLSKSSILSQLSNHLQTTESRKSTAKAKIHLHFRGSTPESKATSSMTNSAASILVLAARPAKKRPKT